MIKVTFYKNIQKYSGTSEHYFNVEDFSSLLNGLREIFPKLARLFKEDCIALTYNKGNLIPNSWVLRDIIPEDVKEINLAAAFEDGRTVSSLSEKDKEMVRKLLQMSGIGRKE